MIAEEVVPCALTPQQAEVLEDVESRYLGFVSGLGGGKTRVACLKALDLGCLNPGLRGLFVEPTYQMIEDIALATFMEIFDEWGLEEGVDYELRRRPPQRLDVWLNDVQFSILFRSSDDPRKLVGGNVAWVVVDEADDHPESAAKALAGRFRDRRAAVRQMFVCGTPEYIGGWFQRWFETEPRARTRLIRGRTGDNHFLPEGYIEDNLGHLDAQERKKYVEGIWVPLGGRIYTRYVQAIHERPIEDAGHGQPVMACDFGQGCMAWFFGRILDDEVHFFHEQVLEGADTFEAAEQARSWWRGHFELTRGLRFDDDAEAAELVEVVCDPAGSFASKADVGETDVNILRKWGFNVHHRKRHPRVRDRINSVQLKLHERGLLVDAERCPYLARAFATHGYDPRTGKPTKGRPRDGARAPDHGTDAVGYLVELYWRAALGRSELSPTRTH